jgi:hypothetical protein
MSPLVVPSATADPVTHADWLELQALTAQDRNSSVQDLASALRRAGSGEELEDEGIANETDDRGGETTEPIAEAAFTEIEDRSKGCSGAYPFSVGTSFLEVTPRFRDPVYLFLLLLSYFGKDAGPPGLNAAQLFEEVSGVVMTNCLGGRANSVETIQFGFPRRIGPAGFKAAVDDLCARVGEGGGSKHQPTLRDQKDAALDLVSWRAFPDKRRAMVMAWGQCATGSDWKAKLSDLQPQAWCTTWLHEMPLVLPLRAFFVPHRIGDTHWDASAAKAGVLFDRCRIAALARPLPPPLRTECTRFSRHVIKERVRS